MDGPAERRLRVVVLSAVLVVHALAAWALARSDAGRRLLAEAVPLMVNLVQPDRPPPEKPRLQPPRPPEPRPRPQAAAPILQATSTEAPAVFEAPPPKPVPVPPPSAPVVAVAAPQPPAAPAPVQEPVIPPSFNAAYLNNPPPEYPRLARRNREQGRVLVRVLVDTAGAPERLELGQSSGSALLDRAAMEAVQQWRFVPARRGQSAVSAWVLVPIHFRLDA
jgi:protein TonB